MSCLKSFSCTLGLYSRVTHQYQVQACLALAHLLMGPLWPVTIFFATANTQKDLQESFLFTLKTCFFISFFKSYCPFYAEGQILYYVTDKNAAPLPETPCLFPFKECTTTAFLTFAATGPFHVKADRVCCGTGGWSGWCLKKWKSLSSRRLTEKKRKEIKQIYRACPVLMYLWGYFTCYPFILYSFIKSVHSLFTSEGD